MIWETIAVLWIIAGFIFTAKNWWTSRWQIAMWGYIASDMVRYYHWL